MSENDDAVARHAKLAKAAFIKAAIASAEKRGADEVGKDIVLDDDDVWRAVARAMLVGPKVLAAPPVEFDGGAVLGPRECHLWYSPTAAARHKRMPMYRLRNGTVTPVTMATTTEKSHGTGFDDAVYLGVGAWDSGSAEYWDEYRFARR